MPIAVVCPKCSTAYEVREVFAGRPFNCHKCRRDLVAEDPNGITVWEPPSARRGAGRRSAGEYAEVSWFEENRALVFWSGGIVSVLCIAAVIVVIIYKGGDSTPIASRRDNDDEAPGGRTTSGGAETPDASIGVNPNIPFRPDQLPLNPSVDFSNDPPPPRPTYSDVPADRIHRVSAIIQYSASPSDHQRESKMRDELTFWPGFIGSSHHSGHRRLEIRFCTNEIPGDLTALLAWAGYQWTDFRVVAADSPEFVAQLPQTEASSADESANIGPAPARPEIIVPDDNLHRSTVIVTFTHVVGEYDVVSNRFGNELALWPGMKGLTMRSSPPRIEAKFAVSQPPDLTELLAWAGFRGVEIEVDVVIP